MPPSELLCRHGLGEAHHLFREIVPIGQKLRAKAGGGSCLGGGLSEGGSWRGNENRRKNTEAGKCQTQTGHNDASRGFLTPARVPYPKAPLATTTAHMQDRAVRGFNRERI